MHPPANQLGTGPARGKAHNRLRPQLRGPRLWPHRTAALRDGRGPDNIHYVNWTCATLWSGSSWTRWTSICSEVTHHACNPAPCLGILLQVQDELLAPSHALEVGKVIIVLPTRGVGVVGQGSPSTIGIEPAWKPPLGHRPTRFRQDQPLIGSGEHPRSRDGQAIAQVQLVGCYVQRIPLVTTPTEVTVVSRPAKIWELHTKVTHGNRAGLSTITPAYTHQDSGATPTYAGTRIRCSGRKYSPAPAKREARQHHFGIPHDL